MAAIVDSDRQSVIQSLKPLAKALPQGEFKEIDRYLQSTGPMTTLAFLLRMDGQILTEIEESQGDGWNVDCAIEQSLNDFNASPLKGLRAAWEEAVGPDSAWRDLIEFRALHSCAIRGPASALRRLLDSPAIRNELSPIAGIIRPVPVRIPECLWDLAEIRAEMPSLHEKMAGISPGLAKGLAEFVDTDSDPEQFANAIQSVEIPEAVAALNWFQRFIQRAARATGFADRDGGAGGHIDRILQSIGKGKSYIDELGIGNITAFGPGAGHGVKVCIVDSGADESIHMLRRQVCDYVRFDAMSQQKTAYACMDAACHGTKMASLVVGRAIKLSDLGLDDNSVRQLTGKTLKHYGLVPSSPVRVGLAPGARIGVAGVLGGNPLAESGTLPNVLAGLDWASGMHAIGHRVVNVSIDADPSQFDAQSRRTFDLLFGLMKKKGMAPIIAAGNRGSKSAPLSTNAWVVGAADNSGTASPNNGPHVTLLAPGLGLLCGQPPLPQLGGLPIDVYGGSSLATAIVSGCVAALMAAFDCGAAEAIGALAKTAHDKMISLDRARAELTKTGYKFRTWP